MPEEKREDRLLTPAEVATLFNVDPKTVTRWAKAGKLSAIRTLGGHRRYRVSAVEEFLGPVDLERLRVSQSDTAPDALLTPGEAATMFHVSPKTITRWVKAGKLAAVRTGGGHRRYRASEVRKLITESEEPSQD